MSFMSHFDDILHADEIERGSCGHPVFRLGRLGRAGMAWKIGVAMSCDIGNCRRLWAGCRTLHSSYNLNQFDTSSLLNIHKVSQGVSQPILIVVFACFCCHVIQSWLSFALLFLDVSHEAWWNRLLKVFQQHADFCRRYLQPGSQHIVALKAGRIWWACSKVSEKNLEIRITDERMALGHL